MRRAMIGGALAVLLATAAAADQVGRQEYMLACAGCHGESALGDGPLAGLLEIETPGLTRLATENGGEFPYREVIATIDGRDELRAHGGPMPIWGNRYEQAALAAGAAEGAMTPDMLARARILSLTRYLISSEPPLSAPSPLTRRARLGNDRAATGSRARERPQVGSEDETGWADAAAPSTDDIAALAEAARAALPAGFAAAAAEVAIRVEDFADAVMLSDVGLEDPFDLTGLYDGIPLTERSVMDQPDRPDTIWLFRRPILDEWVDRGHVTLGQLVAHVYVHELAHHFGWSDDDIAAIDRWWE